MSKYIHCVLARKNTIRKHLDIPQRCSFSLKLLKYHFEKEAGSHFVWPFKIPRSTFSNQASLFYKLLQKSESPQAPFYATRESNIKAVVMKISRVLLPKISLCHCASTDANKDGTWNPTVFADASSLLLCPWTLPANNSVCVARSHWGIRQGSAKPADDWVHP